jgi:hypothetical protein
VTPAENFVAVHGASRLAGGRSPDEAVEALDRLAAGTDLFSSILRHLTRVVGHVRPVGRRLTLAEEEELCRYCYVLALYDECFRMSGGWESPLQRLVPDASVDDALGLVPEAAAADLCALVDGLHRSELASRSGRVIANPSFSGGTLVGGADGDLIIGDCLIDAKTTIQRALKRHWVYQVIGYALLDFDDAHVIRSTGLYHARVPALLAWDFQAMLDEAAEGPVDIAALRRDFRKVLPKTGGHRRSA